MKILLVVIVVSWQVNFTPFRKSEAPGLYGRRETFTDLRKAAKFYTNAPKGKFECMSNGVSGNCEVLEMEISKKGIEIKK
jgi:hypothetical protein